MRKTSPLSHPVTVRTLIMLFAGLPITAGLLVARWLGWGVDGALFGVMTGGIVVAVLFLGVLLLREP